MESESGDHGGVAGVGVGEVEAMYDFIDEGCLGQSDTAHGPILGKGDTQSELGRTKLRYIPSRLE